MSNSSILAKIFVMGVQSMMILLVATIVKLFGLIVRFLGVWCKSVLPNPEVDEKST